MKRSGDVPWGQLKIGLVMAAALGFLIWASIKGGEAFSFGGKQSYHSQFTDVKGLVQGAPVRLNGFEVGAVDRISFEHFARTRRITVRFSINRTALPFLKKDSEAVIAAVGFFGDKYVQISAGSEDAPAVEPGGEVPAGVALDPMEALAAKDGPVTRLPVMMDHLDTLLVRLDRGEGSLGKAMTTTQLHDQLLGLLSDLRGYARSLDENQRKVSGALLRTTSGLDSMTASLNGNGSAGRMLKDSTLYVHAVHTMARLDSLTADMQAGRGNLGRLAKDDALYQQSRAALEDIRSILKDLQENPRKYIKISVF